MVDFEHKLHPHHEVRKQKKAAKTGDERVGLNGKIGVFITSVVGTMWAAYIFVILTLVSLPAALTSGNTVIIVGWIAQTFLQLVLLPIIIVGQNVQSRAADKRSEQTYNDAEAILHECLQLQEHLKAQDEIIEKMMADMAVLKEVPVPAPRTPRARKTVDDRAVPSL